jgi:DNA-binding GntR family transcriptional regulator
MRTRGATLPIPEVSRSETLSRQAYTAIRSSIRTGAITPDGFYSEVQLAHALRISRTPVREALIELEREGLVEIVPQRGFRLRSISDLERQEAYTLRGLIETYVVRRLAKEATDDEIAGLRRLIDHQAKVSGEAASFLEADEDFHLALAAILDLERTRRILLTLRGIIWLAGLDAISNPARTKAVIEEHRAIVDRLAAHDANGAAKAMRSHLENTQRAATERARLADTR